MRTERFTELKESLRIAKKSKDKEQVTQIRNFIGQEKDLINKSLNKRKDKQTITQAKQNNKDRVEKGLNPVFLKKREIKEMRYKDKFDNLEKQGRLDGFMLKKQEEMDKKRK